MKTASKLLQLLALLGAVASAVFYFSASKVAQNDSSQLAFLQSQNRSLRAELETLKSDAANQSSDRAALDEKLENAAAENRLLSSQLLQLQRDNQRLADERETQDTAERRLQKENARLAQELADLRASTVPQDQIATYQTTIADLERKILDLQQTQPTPATAGNLENIAIPTNPSLKGSVLTVGKGASFVILDIGYNDGVRLQNELFIQHADTPIAKIQVTEVKENLSIARVLPESLIKMPQSGDSVASPN